MPHLHHNFDTDEVKQLLEKELPQIQVRTISLLDNGWDNVAFDINGEYIFRFPKSGGAYFDIELSVLKALRGKTAIAIPDVQFLGKSVKYMGYKKLLGCDLTPEFYRDMTNQQRQKLSHDYAQFAWEVHNAISIDRAKDLGIKKEDYDKHLPIINEVLSSEKIPNPDILAFAKDTVREYAETANSNVITSFIYGDLHTENIAFNPDTKQLNGVFDFGDTCIGDIHFEFAPIYKFNTELLENTVHAYEALANIKLSLRKIVLRGRMNELGDLAEYIEQPTSEIYLKAMTRMELWAKEKDVYK